MYGICILNDEFLIARFNGSLNIINISKKNIIKNLGGYSSNIYIKISHPKYGVWLLSGNDSKIVLWKYKGLNFDLIKVIFDKIN